MRGEGVGLRSYAGARGGGGAAVGGGAGDGGMTRSFTSATRLDEALSAMAGGARPVAGGTDQVVGARQGKAPLPEAIVAIDRINGLRVLNVSDSGLRLGAL